MKCSSIILGLLISISSPFASAVAGGIGRVGNSSIGSDELGFVSPIPSQFPVTQILPERIKITSPFIRNSNGQEQFFVETIHTVFGTESESWTRKDWEDLLLLNTDHLWVIANDNPCVAGYHWYNREGQIFGLATWGQGKGIVFTSLGTTASFRAIEQMILQLELSNGACAWN